MDLIKSLLLSIFLFSPIHATSIVWIHGSMPLVRFSTKKPLNIKMFDYYPFHPFSTMGLVKVDINSSSIPALFAKAYENMSKTISHNDNFEFYTFGWSGAIEEQSRLDAAQELYNNLLEIDDKIYIITHSHGGNVALNLSRFNKSGLIVDKLLMLGTPILKSIKKTSLKMFNKIYNVYSTKDPFQTMDTVSCGECYPVRSINTYRFDENVVDIKVIVNKVPPRHQEMWHLGKVPLGVYRRSFPLYPLPISMLSPVLMSCKMTGKINLEIIRKGKYCDCFFSSGKNSDFYSVDNINQIVDLIDCWKSQ